MSADCYFHQEDAVEIRAILISKSVVSFPYHAKLLQGIVLAIAARRHRIHFVLSEDVSLLHALVATRPEA